MSHQLYVVFYILCLLHGLQRITSSPKFWAFFAGPGAIYIIDKVSIVIRYDHELFYNFLVWPQIVSLRRSFFELHVLETEILPSDVIKITFYRPPNFTYRSGQWIRVSCNVLGYSEYHSLTITSAPHEDFLSLHIKARGPWTWRLRNYFDPNVQDNGDGDNCEERLPPMIRLQVGKSVQFSDTFPLHF